MKVRPIVLLLFVLAACGEAKREEVISRFPSGEKEVVAVYRGTGANERIVERYTYSIDGELLLHEDLVNKVTRRWGDLNPQLATSEGLRELLQGEWYSAAHTDVGGYVEHKTSEHMTISGDHVVRKTTAGFTHFGDASNYESSWTLEYLPGFRAKPTVETTDASEDGGDEKSAEGYPEFEFYVLFRFDRPDSFTLIQQVEIPDGRVFDFDVVGRYWRDQERATANAAQWAEDMERLRNQLMREYVEAVKADPALQAKYPTWIQEISKIELD